MVCVVMWSSLVPYVVGAVTVMRVLLFVLDVSMLIACESDSNAGEGYGGGVVAVSVGHDYVGGTRGSGIVSSLVGYIVWSHSRNIQDS